MTSLDDLQGHLDQFMNEQNNRPVKEFEGYSPNEMQYILHDTFGIRNHILNVGLGWCVFIGCILSFCESNDKKLSLKD